MSGDCFAKSINAFTKRNTKNTMSYAPDTMSIVVYAMDFNDFAKTREVDAKHVVYFAK
jgi:hypothetical protein